MSVRCPAAAKIRRPGLVPRSARAARRRGNPPFQIPARIGNAVVDRRMRRTESFSASATIESDITMLKSGRFEPLVGQARVRICTAVSSHLASPAACQCKMMFLKNGRQMSMTSQSRYNATYLPGAGT